MSAFGDRNPEFPSFRIIRKNWKIRKLGNPMKSKSKGLVTYSQVHHKPFSYKNRKTRGNQRSERLMAEIMAFSELVTMDVSMPTPHTMLVLSSSPIWHST